MVQLSVIIVNYNVSYFLEQCLHSVLKAIEGIEAEVFVVDNKSIDGSVEMVRSKFPWVKLIANDENVGFSRANNQAIKIATGKYVLLLNPDTLVEEDTFSKTISYLDEHPDVGGLGVKMIDGQGRFLPESKRGLPTPMVAFYKIFGLSALFPKSKIFGKYHLGYLSREEIHEIDVLSGAFMMMRKKCLDEVGLLDEDFFMYGEDIDLSHRIVLGGYKNVYYPKTRIIHYKGESTKKSSVNYVFVFYRAMVIFAQKHFSQRHAKAFSYLINFAIYLRAGIAIAMRFLRRMIVPFIDALAGFSLLWFLKGKYSEFSGIIYQNSTVGLALGAYVLIWLGAIALAGGYRKPVKLGKIYLGLATGTLVILTLYALLPESLRFSRALILLGTAGMFLTLTTTRLVYHLLKFKSLRLSYSSSKRTGVVADEREFNRIKNLLEDAGNQIDKTQRITPDQALQDINEVAEVYNLETIIFSGDDISSQQIIQIMASSSKPGMEFKIAPPESLYIIGSSSVERSDDLFLMNINAVNKPRNKRRKRLFDVVTSVLFLFSAPLIIWFIQDKSSFLKNCWEVLKGNKTWVGYAPPTKEHLPSLKKGVLNTLDNLRVHKQDEKLVDKLNTVYAKQYSLRTDVNIILKGFKKLGRKP
jgi:GT2 family glycosyltransferase